MPKAAIAGGLTTILALIVIVLIVTHSSVFGKFSVTSLASLVDRAPGRPGDLPDRPFGSEWLVDRPRPRDAGASAGMSRAVWTRRKKRQRALRIFFATDVHGSDRCFRKFVNGADAYDADVLLLGGDVAGKGLVPVRRENGSLTAEVRGERVDRAGRRQGPAVV